MLKSSLLEKTGVAVSTQAATLATLNLASAPGEVLANIEVGVVGATVTALALQFQDHPNGEWYTFLSGTDWVSSGIYSMVAASRNPATLTTGQIAHLIVRLHGAYAARFQMTTDGAGTAFIRGNVKQMGGV